MRPRALLLFILVNVLVTTGVAFVIISVFGSRDQASAVVQYATVEVIITATRDPNATEVVRIVTPTPRPGEVRLPDDIIGEGATDEVTAEGEEESEGATTRSLEQGTDEVGALAVAADGTGTALPENCIPHTLEEGEFPSLLAEQYEVPLNSLLIANGLTEETATLLQIGQVLIIPQEGCSIQLPTPAPETEEAGVGTEEVDADATLDPTAEALALTETATNAATPTPSITPTITLPPTALNAAVQIVEVIAPGDVTAEGLVLRNNGATVNLAGWTVSDVDGNTYTFEVLNLFGNGEVTLFTGSGQDTTIVKYWGEDVAVWGEPGDVVTLTDANGQAQATYRIPAAVNLP